MAMAATGRALTAPRAASGCTSVSRPRDSTAPSRSTWKPEILGQRVAGFFGSGISGSSLMPLGLSRNSWQPVAPRARPTVSAILADVKKAEVKAKEAIASPRNVVAVILGGGAGTRLFPLTKLRAKPAVPIGGAYRLIDVPMSNCINSGISKMYILTQFNSASLNRHLARTYLGNGVSFGDGFVEVLAATQTPGEAGMNWFQGTADAVRQYLWLFEDIRNHDVEDVVILSGDHLYRMDYMEFVQYHKDSGADITISCVPMDDSRASDFGLMKIDETGRIVQFAEKPKGADLKAMQVDTSILGLDKEEATAFPYIASMGIYVFKKDVLLKLLRWRFPTSNDFGSEIIPASKDECLVQAYLFKGYWEDIGTIKSFFEANLGLTDQGTARFKFYDAQKPIYTSPRYLPPTKIGKSLVQNSIVSHGCFIKNNCKIVHTIVGLRARLEDGAQLEDVLCVGADFYETDAERAALLASGKMPIGIGENTVIKNAIIDKNARIGKNCQITNKDNIQEADCPELGYYIRSGIVVIQRNATVLSGTII